LCELLSTLIKTIHGNFQTCASPESFLARATSIVGAEQYVQKVVLVGASNLRSSAVHFSSAGYDVQDLTVPGWVASPENIEKMKAKVEETSSDSNTVFIFDLLGNSAYRFEQYDGTQSLPFRVNNRFHLAGNVVTCALPTFKKLVDGVLPIIAGKRDGIGLIVPPLPRYLFVGCCGQKEHCQNVSDPNHARKMLSDIIGLRSSLKKLVINSGLTNVRVLDTCCVTSCAGTANTESRLCALRDVMAPDGVHYLSDGYANFVSQCASAAAASFTKTDVSRTNQSQTKHFWRGFRSSIGAKTAVHGSGNRATFARGSKRGRPGRHFHPYKRN
jgi:hypothetical protein